MAQQSGVSVSTASRALSGSSRISAATRERVRRVADALGYRPNAMAQGLRTNRSRLVGLVVTNLVNASFQEIARVAQARLGAAGYQMVLVVTGGKPQEERSSLEALLEHGVDGLVAVVADARALSAVRTAGVPVVHLARRPRQPVGDCVLGAETEGAREATCHLLELGHRRIATVTGPTAVTSGAERLAGYRLALSEWGVPWRDELVHSVALDPTAGASAVATLLGLPSRQRPTALLLSNHEAAQGALPALREAGVAIPGDLSVMCFEDDALTRYWHPALTVMDNNAGRMGELAVSVLLDRIAGRDTAGGPGEYRVAARLVVRDSTAAPRSVPRARYQIVT
ncbi:MAG: LacI family DNA-binding transcriptional regulator [Actinomycetales bacterium]